MRCFLDWKLKLFLNSYKIFRKLLITESDYTNVAGAASLKLLSLVDISLRILKKFRKSFLKKHLRKAAPAAFQ